MFIKKSSIFIIFFIFLNHFGFTEELITKHKIEFTKYRYYQDYEVVTGQDNILRSLNHLKKNKEVVLGFKYKTINKNSSSFIKLSNNNETSIFFLNEKSENKNKFDNSKFSKIENIKQSTFVNEVFIKIPQFRKLHDEIWIYKSLDNLILKIYDKKLINSNSISIFTDLNLDLSKYFISANAFNENNEIYEWSMKNMIQKNDVSFITDKNETLTLNKSTLSNDGKKYKFIDSSKEEISHIIIFFDKSLVNHLNDLYYAKFENEIYYEPLFLEDEYVLYNFISKLNHLDDIDCINCYLESLFIFDNQVEEFIPYFHFDHINKLKDYLSNNNSYLSSILQDKKNLVYLNDAVLKLIKFNPNDISNYKQLNYSEYLNDEKLEEFRLLNYINLKEFYIIDQKNKIINLDEFFKNICNQKNSFLPLADNFVKTSLFIESKIDTNFLNCYYDSTKSIEFLYIDKKQKYLNDDIFLKYDNDIKIKIKNNKISSQDGSLLNLFIIAFDILMIIIFFIIFKFNLNISRYIYLLFFVSFIFLLFINSKLFTFFIYELALYIIFSYLLFFLLFKYIFMKR